MKLSRPVIYIIILFSMLFWGMSFVWTKIVLNYYEPITTIFLRLVLSTIILFSGLMLFKRVEKIRKEDYKLFLVSAFFNPFLYFLGENFGVKYSTATISAVIIATIPLFVPMVAYFALSERLKKINLIGIIISFTGITVMMVNKDLTLNASPFGVACLFLAVGSAVIYSIMLKILAGKYSAFTIVAVQNLIGVILFLPIFLVFDYQSFILVKPNVELISSLILLSFFASSLAFVFFTIGTREIGVSKTAVFSNIIPIFTAVFSYFILSEYFNLNKIVGMIIVLFGVFFTQIGRLKKLKG
ncbi:MAG: DMT family transporter [Bacteroidales bacterium]|nr:DMT family transporter [Bacteroidales bacterium]